jgi:hypothetical protein
VEAPPNRLEVLAAPNLPDSPIGLNFAMRLNAERTKQILKLLFGNTTFERSGD